MQCEAPPEYLAEVKGSRSGRVELADLGVGPKDANATIGGSSQEILEHARCGRERHRLLEPWQGVVSLDQGHFERQLEAWCDCALGEVKCRTFPQILSRTRMSASP